MPGGTATWTFTDATGNYNNASGTAAIVITKADATISGDRLHRRLRRRRARRDRHGDRRRRREPLRGLDLGASFTNVPGGTANWTFTDVTGNYNNKSGSAAITITTAFAFNGFYSPIGGSVETTLVAAMPTLSGPSNWAAPSR